MRITVLVKLIGGTNHGAIVTAFKNMWGEVDQILTIPKRRLHPPTAREFLMDLDYNAIPQLQMEVYRVVQSPCKDRPAYPDKWLAVAFRPE